MAARAKSKPSRRHLPPKNYLAAIGAVAVIWTAIEGLMEMTILGLYEIDLGRGLVLTSNLSFHARASLLRILTNGGAVSDAALAKEMLELLSRVDMGFGDRNTVVHGLWRRSQKTPGAVRRLSVRARGKKLDVRTKEYSATELWEIADRLGQLLHDFNDLANRLDIEDRLKRAPRHSTASRN